MKDQVNKLIEKLAPVMTVNCGCDCHGCVDRCDGKSYPLLIGSVLERMENSKQKQSEKNHDFDVLCELWRKCGFTKSLQQILEEGWEEVEVINIHGDDVDLEWKLKQPARELFEFLIEIFL